MERKQQLEAILPLMHFFSEMLGPDAEIILYDVDDRVVYQVLNPMGEEMVPGSERRSLERKFLESHLYEKGQVIVNYRALARSKHKLKSATSCLNNNQQ